MLQTRYQSALHHYAVCLGLVVAGLPQTLPALTFGPESVESYLGQPLRVSFRLRGVPAELEPSCLRLLEASSTDGVATINQGNLKLERRAGETFAVLTTTRSINEPVLSIALSNSCGSPSRRDYLLLLDLPPDTRPSLASLAPSLGPIAPSSAPPFSTFGGSTLGRGESDLAATAARASGQQQGRRVATREPASPRSRAQGSAPVSKSNPSKATQALVAEPLPRSRETQDRLRIDSANPSARIDDALMAALAAPKLRLTAELLTDLPLSGQASTTAQDPLQKAIADERRARLRNSPIEQDLAPQLESELILTRRKLDELQAELKRTPTPPSAPAGTAQAKPGQAAGTDPWWSNWPLWSLLTAALAGLVAALVWIRRGRASPSSFEKAAADLPLTEPSFKTSSPKPTNPPAQALASTHANKPSGQLRASDSGKPSRNDKSVTPATEKTTESSSPPAANLELAPAASSAGAILSSKPVRETHYSVNTDDVDVEELSQVTEEAQVYVELGRTDQAISLLKQHIETHKGQRSSPAPWLMLLDLYRKTGNREAYERLAPEFQLHFNGRMPSWDNYGHELALDDGLEAFPELVASISSVWHTQRARELLEEMLYDNRSGSRLGFSLGAYRDILMLMQIHDKVMADGALVPKTPPALGSDDQAPKWTLAMDTVEGPTPSSLDKWLSRPKDSN